MNIVKTTTRSIFVLAKNINDFAFIYRFTKEGIIIIFNIRICMECNIAKMCHII